MTEIGIIARTSGSSPSLFLSTIVGFAVGKRVGTGDCVRAEVGDSVGAGVVGDCVGAGVVGDSVGAGVVGDSVGAGVVGDSVGTGLGDSVGIAVVGETVGANSMMLQVS